MRAAPAHVIFEIERVLIVIPIHGFGHQILPHRI